jgi:hypothetical protein
MSTNRVTLRIVNTFRLGLFAATTATLAYGVSQYQNEPTMTVQLILVAGTVATAVYFMSCVYHIVQLVRLESEKRGQGANQ